MTIIQQLPDVVKPIQQVDKVKEVVSVLNEIQNLSYSTKNPDLIPSSGVCAWTITHNLATENVLFEVYSEAGDRVLTNGKVLDENSIVVYINSATNISAESYYVIVTSNGASAISSTTITVDTALSPTSENPVQNRVLYPSLSGFIQRNTNITVKTDGSGNFTNLQDAVNYLNGKWSNGIVIISLDAGTFSSDKAVVIYPQNFNIPELRIVGAGVNSTTLKRTGTTHSGGANYIGVVNIQAGYSTEISFNNITFEQESGTLTTDYRGIVVDNPGCINVNNCNFKKCNGGVNAYSGTNVFVQGTLNFEGCQAGLSIAGRMGTGWGVNLNFTGCTTGLTVVGGGIMQLNHAVCSFTSTTNKTNVTKNTVNANGMILAADSTGL